jgi:hypothetical protein
VRRIKQITKNFNHLHRLIKYVICLSKLMRRIKSKIKIKAISLITRDIVFYYYIYLRYYTMLNSFLKPLKFRKFI